MDDIEQQRNGDWMQTYTGKQFWPVDPLPEEIDIRDIAHGLSLMCRYNGHCERFYSVAEHCCHLYDYASDDNKLWALLHDASEAYIADIIRPVKPFLSNYIELENNLMDTICIRYDLPLTMPKEVKDLDNRILVDEMTQNLKPPVKPWNIPNTPLGVKLEFWTPEEAEREFLSRFDKSYSFMIKFFNLSYKPDNEK